MKRRLAFSFFALWTLSAFAQGTVTFQNSVVFQTPDPSGGNRLVYADCVGPIGGGGAGLVGTQFVAELYAGTSAGSLAPVTASTSRFRSSTTANRGKWATTAISGLNDPTVLPGIDFGQFAFLQVKVWDLSAFKTYESAIAGGGTTGVSSVFTYKVPQAGDLTVTDFYMENLQAFAVPAVLCPEPSAILVGILGVLCLCSPLGRHFRGE